EFAGHRVRMGEIALGRVVDDVGEREIEILVTELQRIRCGWFLLHLVKKERVNGGRLFAEQSGESGALGAVSFPGGAETAEEVDLEPSGFGEFIGGQFG